MAWFWRLPCVLGTLSICCYLLLKITVHLPIAGRSSGLEENSTMFVEGLVGQGVGEVVLGAFDMGEGDGGKFGREVAGLFVEWKQVVMADFVAAVHLVD